MSAPTCVVCGRPTADGYACVDETRRAVEQLRQIVDMVPAARDVAHNLSRRGGGGAPGKPGSRLPLDLTATAKLDAVQGALTTWARHVAEERGITRAAAVINAGGLSGVDGGSGQDGRSPDGGDDLVASALWLTGHCEWMRHTPAVDEFLTDIAAAARVVAGIARGPAAQKYLGPCGADRGRCEGLEPDDWPEADCGNHTPHAPHDRPPCDGNVYGYVGAEQGRCRTCAASVDQGDRREWLAGLTRDRAYRASEIEDAHGIKAHNIRNWADKGRIRVHGRDHLGRNLYLLGDVLDHARDLATRKADNQAKRAARAPA